MKTIRYRAHAAAAISEQANDRGVDNASHNHTFVHHLKVKWGVHE